MDENIQNVSRSRLITKVIIGLVVIAILAAVAYLVYNSGLIWPTAAAVNIELANCNSISPQVASMTNKQAITFKNDDKVSHVIFIGGQSIDVPAGGSASLKARLAYGIGMYGYACDGGSTQNQIIVTNQ